MNAAWITGRTFLSFQSEGEIETSQQMDIKKKWEKK